MAAIGSAASNVSSIIAPQDHVAGRHDSSQVTMQPLDQHTATGNRYQSASRLSQPRREIRQQHGAGDLRDALVPLGRRTMMETVSECSAGASAGMLACLLLMRRS